MDRAILASSIRDWDRLYRQAREKLISRSGPPLATRQMGCALIGVRRCGKTYTAIDQSRAHAVEDVLYYNFEDPAFIVDNAVGNLDLLLDVAAEIRGRAPRMLILDEIHNVANWERWLRKILDQREYEVIVTGSSAKLLSRELATAVAGRCLESRIWPLSFAEYQKFRGLSPGTRGASLAALGDFVRWGGFPEVVLCDDHDTKRRILEQYLSDIVFRDVQQRSAIRNHRALMQVLTYCFTNLSSMHSQSSLKKAFGIGTDTASEILSALADAMLLFGVQRYHPNLKVQARDPIKTYVIDTGLRSVAARSPNDDTGKLLENMVYLELQRRGHAVWYYREEAEVDFIVTEAFRPTCAIQVCADLSDPDTRERELRAMKECLERLALKAGTIVSWDHEEHIRTGDMRIQVIPAYIWLGNK